MRAALDGLTATGDDRRGDQLSTMRAADLILVLQAGRVIEAGRHARLLARRACTPGWWNTRWRGWRRLGWVPGDRERAPASSK